MGDIQHTLLSLSTQEDLLVDPTEGRCIELSLLSDL